ncbi:MAG: DUF4440 domain-containing protein [Dehalococcoidia bacterium]|nr:DUF4440 domain-containing protein [Dehalococcoidia bacterium]
MTEELEREREAVRQANAAFYAAFQSLDTERMRAVWAQSDAATVVHPGWRPLAGIGPVMESWRRIFEGATLMQFTVTGVQVHFDSETTARVLCLENLTTVLDGAVSEGRVQATNVFVKAGGRWLLVHHHGSPVM